MTEFWRAYGGALFSLAQDEGLEESFLKQFESICAILKENPVYIRLIDDKSIAKTERLSLLEQAFSGKLHPYMLNFMKLLCERGCFKEIYDCLADYQVRYNEKYGIIPTKVITAEPLSDAQFTELKQALERKTGKQVTLNVQVNPAIVGGLRVEMAGKSYDNTLEGRLNYLRRALAAKS